MKRGININNKHPKISVITPSFNQGEFLEATINSVLEQDYPNLEYMIIDGGSTDNSVSIIKKYEKYLTYWCSEKDNGQTNAINKGIKKASGDIVAWLNSDDFYYPGALSTISEMYMSNPEAGLYIGNGSIADRNGNRIREYSKTLNFDYDTLLKGSNYILQPSTFININAIKDVGLLDESLHYAMDLEYWLRVASKYPVRTVNRELAAYRWYDEIKTRNGGIKRWVEQWNIISKYSNLQITPGLLVEFFKVLQEKEINDQLGMDITEFSRTAWIHFYKIMQKLLDTDDCIPRKEVEIKNAEKVVKAPAGEKNSADIIKHRTLNIIKSRGSKIKIDVVLPEGHSYFLREAYVNALKYFGIFNRAFYVNSNRSDTELFNYLKNPDSDFIFLLNTDWHAQQLHNNSEWQKKWSSCSSIKVLFSFECMNNPVVRQNVTWWRDNISAVDNAMKTTDAVIYAHEIDGPLFERYGVPARWQPFSIDEELFPTPKKFSQRQNKAFFRGKTTPFYYEETYSTRRKLIDTLKQNSRIDLYDSYTENKGSTRDRALQFINEMSSYQITLCLPSLSPTMVIRPFEAMASGCACFQNKIEGQKSIELFKDNESIIFYNENNPEELNEQVNYLLDNPDYAKIVAENGYAEVLNKHTTKHRIKDFLAWLSNGYDDASKIMGNNEMTSFTSIELAEDSSETKIVIDGVIFQLQKSQPLGISRVWESLLLQLSKMTAAKNIVLLDRGGTCPDIPGIKRRIILPFTSYNHTEAEAYYLQDICEEEKASLFISTYFTYAASTPSLLVVHDFIPEHFQLQAMEWQAKKNAMKKAAAFICVSESTSRDLKKYYPDESDKKIFVVPNAVTEDFRVHTSTEINNFREKYKIEKPYFLISGSRGSYKNVVQFAKAFSKLKNKADYEILFTGGNGNLEPEIQEHLIGTKSQVLNLPTEELSMAYSGAAALVYPSKYEGFGLPVLEAMKCGCPVITCRNSSLAEVACEAAIFVKEDDVSSMKNALTKIAEDGVRKKLIEKGLVNAGRYSWKRSAELLLAATGKVFENLQDVSMNSRDYLNDQDSIIYQIKKHEKMGPALANIGILLNSGALPTEEEFEWEEGIITRYGADILNNSKDINKSNKFHDPYLLYFEGLNYFNNKKYEEAFNSFMLASVNGLNHWRINYLAAKAALVINKKDKAAKLFNLCLQANPGFEPARKQYADLKRSADDMQNVQSKIKLSAIVSTFNSEYFIKGCLEDLVSQSLYKKGELEIVIVNSGSEQNEDKIINEFIKGYSNIKYIKTSVRESIYKAWNRGIIASSGDYITNANTDDRHTADAYEKMVKILDSNDTVDVVYSNDLQTNIANDLFYSESKKIPLKWSEFDKDLLLFGCFIGPHPVWKKSLHDKFGYFDEKLKVVGDYEFWLRISSSSKFVHLDEELGLYYYSDKSAEHRDKSLTDRENLDVRNKYLIKCLCSETDLRRVEIKLEYLETLISDTNYINTAKLVLKRRHEGLILESEISRISDNEMFLEDGLFLKKTEHFKNIIVNGDSIIDKTMFLGILNTLEGIYYYNEKEISRSSEMFCKALTYDPFNNIALQGLANIFTENTDKFVYNLLLISEELLGQNKLDEAKYLLEKVVGISNNLDALNNLAAIEIINNNLAAAMNLVEKVLVVDPANEIAINNLNYINQLV